MLFNILLVLLVTCLATGGTPTSMLANNYDVTIENASHAEPEDDDTPAIDEEDDDQDENELVAYDPSSEHVFSFDADDDDADKI